MLAVAAVEVALVVGLVHLEQARWRPTKHTPAATITDSVTPTKLLAGAWSQTAMIEPGRGRSPQAGVEDQVDATPVMPPSDHGEDHLRLHQHVREVDLVDAAEELDDAAPGADALARPLPEHAVGEQQAEAGAGVGLDQEQDRLALLGRLGRCRAA